MSTISSSEVTTEDHTSVFHSTTSQVWIQTSHPQGTKPPTSQAKSLLASLCVCLLYTNRILLQCSAWLPATCQWLNNDRERSSLLFGTMHSLPSLKKTTTHFYFCAGVHVMHVFTGQKGIKILFKFFFDNPVIFTALQLFIPNQFNTTGLLKKISLTKKGIKSTLFDASCLAPPIDHTWLSFHIWSYVQHQLIAKLED